jgi:hypothetical protein
MSEKNADFYVLVARIREEFKPLIDTGVFKVNDLLLSHYQQETGQQDFKTFQEWKKQGYIVKRGEHGVKIFSKPLKNLKEERGQEAGENDARRFLTATIFHAGQVEPIKTNQNQ